MNRPYVVGLISCLSAWLLFRFAAAHSVVPVPMVEAADQLREAWAGNHTVA